MNSIHNNGEGDSKLHDDLTRIDDAYKRLEQQEPPELLDSAVLNSAHRAVEKKTGWMQIGWLHGLTTAAVIVVAISVVLQQREPGPVFEDSTGIQAPIPLPAQKAAEKTSLQATSEPRRSEVEKDDTLTVRKKTAAPASRSITEKKAAGNEMLEMQVSGDEPAAEASVVIYEEESEPRLDADKKEMPVERVPDDEMSGMTGAVAEEVSLETARDAKQAGLQQIDNIMAQELDKIIALKEAGDDSWRAELQAFKQRYPDYPIPPDLEP